MKVKQSKLYIPVPVQLFGDKMPKEGFTQITVSNTLKDKLKRAAKAVGLSMPRLIRKMLGEQYPEHLADEAGKRLKILKMIDVLRPAIEEADLKEVRVSVEKPCLSFRSAPVGAKMIVSGENHVRVTFDLTFTEGDALDILFRGEEAEGLTQTPNQTANKKVKE